MENLPDKSIHRWAREVVKQTVSMDTHGPQDALGILLQESALDTCEQQSMDRTQPSTSGLMGIIFQQTAHRENWQYPMGRGTRGH
jgi:hypothetical protein